LSVPQNIPEAAIERSRFDERAMRSKRWKLILRDFHDTFGLQKNELYDMETDPLETKNLYYDLAYRQPLEAELKLMLYWSELNEDNFAIKPTKKELSTLSNPK